MAENRLNVRQFGAVGDGHTDDYEAIQRTLDEGRGGVVEIPAGIYRVTRTLRIHSGTELRADADAHIVHCGSLPKHEGDHLLTNDDGGAISENIVIDGGVWDGNFDGVNNTKPDDLFAPHVWSGAMLNFVGVRNLTLRNMTLINSVVFYVRMARLDGFLIEKIRFGARRLSFNQDGLHFGGECRNGIVRDIEAYDRETNDDMIALNADDSLERLENRGLVRGPIENIVFEDICAEDCYTFVRLLSVYSPIRNIRFRRINCGCRMYAINMDGARYCRTPLMEEKDYPLGSGWIENVSFEGMRIRATACSGNGKEEIPLICAETRCKGFSIRDFSRDYEADARPEVPTLLARNLVNTRIGYETAGKEKSRLLRMKEEQLEINEPFDALLIENMTEE